jgi:hypothetical protein
LHLFIRHASSLPRPPVWIGTMIEKGGVVGQGVGYCNHDCMQLRLHACPIACLPAAPSSSIVRPNWRSSGRQRLIQQSDLAARVTIEAKRNTPVRYGAADQAMQCHHRFVGPNASLLSRNSPDEVWPPVVTQCGRCEGADRVPAESPRGFYVGAPELAVEVLSPGNRHTDLRENIPQWLDAGTRLVWVVDTEARTVAVHAPGADPVLLRAGDVLTGGDVVPGFAHDVADVFA